MAKTKKLKRAPKEVKNTKKNLKTMSKNGSSHKLRTSRRVVKYGAVGFARNIWLSIAAILVMTMTLLCLFFTVVATDVLSSTADSIREKIDFTIYFKPGTSQEILDAMAGTMRADSNVKSAEVSSSNDETAKIIQKYSEDETIASALEDEDQMAAILSAAQSIMRIKVYDIEDISSIKNIVETDQNFIDNIDPDNPPTYDSERSQIQKINSWARVAKYSGLILTAVFLAISVLVIFNTIRMAIFSRREEIYMMKLVGADNPFIRGPFLIEAQMCGIISGLIAATLGYIGYRSVAPGLESYGVNIENVKQVLESSQLILVYAAIIIVGVIIGTISAHMAVHKYLKK